METDELIQQAKDEIIQDTFNEKYLFKVSLIFLPIAIVSSIWVTYSNWEDGLTRFICTAMALFLGCFIIKSYYTCKIKLLQQKSKDKNGIKTT